MSDVKALADWIRAAAPFDPENWGQHQDQSDAAADALEASVQAPENNAVLHQCPVTREVNDMNGYCSTCQEVHRAFSASVQAPAVVDRLAAIEAIHGAVAAGPGVAGKAVDSLFASGILLDAAEVEARGLEKAADIADSIGHVNNNQHSHIAWEAADAIRSRAQQVREGN